MRGAPLLGVRAAPAALAATQLAQRIADGVVVDIRPAAAYAAQHAAGTLNIPLGKSFTTWSGWLLRYDQEIALIAPDPATATEAQRALASIGLDHVVGAFDLDALVGSRATITKGDINAAPAMQAAGRLVIDLREPNEWNAGHLDGAELHPLGTVTTTLAVLDRTTPLAIHCQAGARSAIGASVLERMGFTDVVDLTAGYGGRTTG